MAMKYITLISVFFALLNLLNGFVSALTVVNTIGKDTIIRAPNIVIKNGIIKCGKIVCPANSFSCSVRGKSVDKNNANVKTTMTCKAKDGKVITKKVKKLPNVIPGLAINTYSSANIEGKIQNCQSCSDSGEAKTQTKDAIKAAMEDMIKHIKNIHVRTHDLGQQMTDFTVNDLAKKGVLPVSLNKIQTPQTVTQIESPKQKAPPKMETSEPSLVKPMVMMSKPPTSESSAPVPLSSAAKPVPPPYLPETGTPSFPMSLSMSRSLGSISSGEVNKTGPLTPATSGVAPSNQLPSSGATIPPNASQNMASTNASQVQNNPTSVRPMVSDFSARNSEDPTNPPPSSVNPPPASVNLPPALANPGSANMPPGSEIPVAATAYPSASPTYMEPSPASNPQPALTNSPPPPSNPAPPPRKKPTHMPPQGKSIGKFSSVSDGNSAGKSPSSSSSSSSSSSKHHKALERNVKPTVDGPSDSSASSSSSAEPLQRDLKPSIGSMLSSTRRSERRHRSIGSMLSSPISTHSSTLNTHHIRG